MTGMVQHHHMMWWTVSRDVHRLTVSRHDYRLTVSRHVHSWTTSLHDYRWTGSRHVYRWTGSRHVYRWTVSRHVYRWTVSRHVYKWTVSRHVYRWTGSKHDYRWTGSKHDNRYISLSRFSYAVRLFKTALPCLLAALLEQILCRCLSLLKNILEYKGYVLKRKSAVCVFVCICVCACVCVCVLASKTCKPWSIITLHEFLSLDQAVQMGLGSSLLSVLIFPCSGSGNSDTLWWSATREKPSWNVAAIDLVTVSHSWELQSVPKQTFLWCVCLTLFYTGALRRVIQYGQNHHTFPPEQMDCSQICSQ